MRRSLRIRLLAIVLVGIIILTATNALLSGWGLTRVRDRAIADNAEVLEQRTQVYLLRMAQERAASTDQTLNAIQELAEATARYLAQARPPSPADAPALQNDESDWYYYHDKTTILLPVVDDPQPMLNDLIDSQGLNELFPGMASATPEIARISYMTASGTVRTFPQLPLFRVPAGWTVESDPSYQASLPANNRLRKVVWSTEAHPLLDDLTEYRRSTASKVISAIAPVYQGRTFKGAVIVDIGRDRLTASLGRLGVTQTGFAFLLDEHGDLVGTSKEGQEALLGKTVPEGEMGDVPLDGLNPSFDPILAEMRAGKGGYGVANLSGRPHILAYAPVAEIKWSFGLAVPLDEVVVDTARTAEKVTGIANETQTYTLLASLGAVILLGMVVGYVLRRQFTRPLTALVAATRSVAGGDLRPIAARSGDELGDLAHAFNTMTEAVAASRAELTEANHQLERKIQERTADLNMAVAKLEATSAAQEDLLRALREVSTPVIPVVAGVLAMPLIGQIDEQRAQNMIAALLERVEREHARTVLLDITGVPVIDAHVAQSLLRMVAAGRLLGAEIVLVGVAPEVAQTLVTLGIDLRELRTAPDLRSAVERILAKRRDPRAAPGPSVL
jgi:anti-anti-sigma regulatory factor/HAMP domain-containing protein